MVAVAVGPFASAGVDDVALGVSRGASAALGVFGRFQITDFNVFLGCHSACELVLVFRFVVRLGLCGVGGTEQQLTPADDVSFRDQVIELDQLGLPALPAILWIPGGRLV